MGLLSLIMTTPNGEITLHVIKLKCKSNLIWFLIIFDKLKSKIASPLRSKKLSEIILCETLKILFAIVVFFPVSIVSMSNMNNDSSNKNYSQTSVVTDVSASHSDLTAKHLSEAITI